MSEPNMERAVLEGARLHAAVMHLVSEVRVSVYGLHVAAVMLFIETLNEDRGPDNAPSVELAVRSFERTYGALFSINEEVKSSMETRANEAVAAMLAGIERRMKGGQ